MVVVGPFGACSNVEDFLYLDDGHFAVLILGVHEEEVQAVDGVAVGLAVEDGDDIALSAVEVAEGVLDRGEGTPGW